MNTVSREKKDVAVRFCTASNDPAFVINDNLICEYSNDESLIKNGDDCAGFLKNCLDLPIVKATKFMLCINNIFYCAEMAPISDELFICRLLDSDSILDMARFTGLYEKLTDNLSSLKYGFLTVERGFKKVLKNENIENDPVLDSEFAKLTHHISLSRINLDELVTFFEISLSRNRVISEINIVEYVNWVVDRYNTHLLKLGNCIDFTYSDSLFMINANKRYTLFALVNLIYYALIFSEKNTSVELTMQSKGKEYVVFTTWGHLRLSVPEGTEREFLIMQENLSLEIVKQYVVRSGGTYEVREENGNFMFGITLPLTKSGALKVESNSVADFNNSFLDYIGFKFKKYMDNFLNIEK